MDFSQVLANIEFEKVSDLTKQQFIEVLNRSFEEFLRSKELLDAIFNSAEQAIANHR